MKIVGDSITFDLTPEHGWRTIGWVAPGILLLLGALLYAKSRVPWHGWPIYFAGTGLFFLNGSVRVRRVITKQDQRMKTTYSLFFIPLWRRSRALGGFSCVKRVVKRASGYDVGCNKEIYRPAILLVEHSGKELMVQQFHDVGEQEHHASLENARHLARFLGLELKEHIESWQE